MKKLLSIICMAALLISAVPALAGDSATQNLGFNVSNLSAITVSGAATCTVATEAQAKTEQTCTPTTYNVFNNGASKKITMAEKTGVGIFGTDGTCVLFQAANCYLKVGLAAPAGGAQSAGLLYLDDADGFTGTQDVVTGIGNLDVQNLAITMKIRAGNLQISNTASTILYTLLNE